MTEPHYRRIIEHYEACLKQYGTGARAVDWKSDDDAAKRYEIMLGVLRYDHRQVTHPVTLLDFGCGLGDLKVHIARLGAVNIAYHGLDASPEFAAAARMRHPDATIHCCDILEDSVSLPKFDYIIMNGIFTRRHDLSLLEMTDYMQRLVARAFKLARIGLAFNVMSEIVDWNIETLFHPKLSDIAGFVGKNLSKHFILRNDYGLHETTCYIYREPTVGVQWSHQQP